MEKRDAPDSYDYFSCFYQTRSKENWLKSFKAPGYNSARVFACKFEWLNLSLNRLLAIINV